MRQQTLAEIRRRLIHGHWPPDTVLQEQTLADELQVSKTPVREALQTLSVQNLVKPVPRLGYVVSAIDLNDLVEVFEFRILLEGEMVATLASRGTVLAEAGDTSADTIQEHELVFHQNIGRLGGGPRMRHTLDNLVEESSRAMHYYRFSDQVLGELVGDHRAILGAIETRDVVLARSLITIHLTRIRESLMANLRQRLRDQNLLA